jgi:beta-lactamase superfamily II metal-dependent hydrolase
MAVSAITLEVLPAGYGDCLLVSCPIGKRTWRMLIDTGPDEAYPQLRARLAQIPLDGQGRRHIDLFIVTHIDHDHIGGAALLLGDKTLRLSFGDIWFNAPKRAAPRGVAEGESLATILGARAQALPWNKAFEGKPVVTDGEGAALRVAQRRGAPLITLLSPTPERLARLFRVWDRELAKLRAKEVPKAKPRTPAPRGRIDVEALAAKATPTDRAVANVSSIALLLEHRGASVLLCADAAPTTLVPALKSLAGARGLTGAMKVDAVKLSHHGSRANVTQDLLRAVQADHYVVSTNNAIFDHPDDEAIARVLVQGGKSKTLWFNYATDRNRKWAAQDLADRYQYRCLYPGPDSRGVSIALGARSA